MSPARRTAATENPQPGLSGPTKLMSIKEQILTTSFLTVQGFIIEPLD
jgi:hypothetical protein